jgi:hypothetical protein
MSCPCAAEGGREHTRKPMKRCGYVTGSGCSTSRLRDFRASGWLQAQRVLWLDDEAADGFRPASVRAGDEAMEAARLAYGGTGEGAAELLDANLGSVNGRFN